VARIVQALSALRKIASIPVSQVACGDLHTAFLTLDGKVFTCGENYSGQLGRAASTGGEMAVNLGPVPGLPPIAYLACGGSHTVLVALDGSAYSCGQNYSGQLGRAVATGSETEVNLGQIGSLSGVARASCGMAHTVFASQQGAAFACGANDYVQLGWDGFAAGSESDVNLGMAPGLQNVARVACGDQHSVFVTSLGVAYTCGRNILGQLGRVLGNSLDSVPGLPGDIVDAACGYSHSIFLAANGDVYSCGANQNGQLGRIAADGDELAANLGQIPGLPAISDVGSGGAHSVFLDAAGNAYDCGVNHSGELGRGGGASGREDASNLGQVTGLPPIVRVAGKGGYTAFFSADGKVFTCGLNYSGQLGRQARNGSAWIPSLDQVMVSQWTAPWPAWPAS
jgi:alpha-tubulin suppressor-like RCC1 family protein